MLDIPELVRGPTLVLLPSGKEIKVPRMERRDIVAPAEIHSQLQGNAKLQRREKSDNYILQSMHCILLIPVNYTN